MQTSSDVSAGGSWKDDWKKDNPDWEKDWSKGCATASREFKWTGEAASSGWNEVLDKASKAPGSHVKKI